MSSQGRQVLEPLTLQAIFIHFWKAGFLCATSCLIEVDLLITGLMQEYSELQLSPLFSLS
jgi:hypothetical protein